MRFLLPLLLVVALPVGAEPVKPGYAPPFTLSDQHAAAKTVSYPTTKPTVLVVSDHKGSAEVADWVAPLYKKYGKRIDISGLAQLPGIPSPFHGLFRREFKARLAYPVLLDWTGDVAKAFNPVAGKANVVVIARDGKIAATQNGPIDKASLGNVTGVIDGLLAE